MDIEKIKNHFKKNKWTYIFTGATVVLAGITVLIVKGHKTELALQVGPGFSIADPVLPRQGDASPFIYSVGNNNSPITTNVYNGTRGHPGFITRCFETNEVFTSQSSAAKTYGINPKVLSEHLAGVHESANGLHFERIGVFQ